MILDQALYDATSFGSAQKILCRCDSCAKESLIAKQKIVQRGGYRKCHSCTITKHGKSRSYIESTCISCGKVEHRRHDALTKWSGKCRVCSIKEVSNRPEIRKNASNRAREQVLRQGGIANANKFTSEQVRGSANYNWKGGITSEHMKIRMSSEMQAWRVSVMERDDYTCQVCKKRGGNLHADHIKPFALYPELRFDMSNGRTLCVSCHRQFGALVFNGKISREAKHVQSHLVTNQRG